MISQIVTQIVRRRVNFRPEDVSLARSAIHEVLTKSKKRSNSCNVGKTMPETIPNHHFYGWYKAFPNWWFMTFYDIVLTTSQNDCINMLLIWSCFWSNMTLRFASAVRVFENPFSEFPFSPCNDIHECNSLTRVDGLILHWRSSMSVAVPRGLVNVPFWEYWTSPYSSHYRPYT